MGMFDRIWVKEFWCPFCGHKMENCELQSKDGECSLSDYYSFESFGETIPNQYGFHVVSSCEKCNEFIELQVRNTSKAAFEYQEEVQAKWREEDRLRHERWRIQANAEHPNHELWAHQGNIPLYGNRHCEICKSEGVEDNHPDNKLYLAWLEKDKELGLNCINCKHKQKLHIGNKCFGDRTFATHCDCVEFRQDNGSKSTDN